MRTYHSTSKIAYRRDAVEPKGHDVRDAADKGAGDAYESIDEPESADEGAELDTMNETVQVAVLVFRERVASTLPVREEWGERGREA